MTNLTKQIFEPLVLAKQLAKFLEERQEDFIEGSWSDYYFNPKEVEKLIKIYLNVLT